MGTANHWGGPVTTGTQQYARLFVEDEWRVAYLSDPVSPFQLVNPKSWLYNRRKFGLWAKGGEQHFEGRMYAYNHLTLLPIYNLPLLRSRLAVRRSLDLSVPPLTRTLARQGFRQPQLLWIDHLVFEGLLDRLSPGASLYRMADDPALFPGPYPPALLRRLPDLLRRVDLVVATAHRLVERVRARRTEGVIYLPNGVDYDHFAPSQEEPSDLASIPRPRALYVGSLEPWFDTGIVTEAARSLPDTHFVIVGPPRIDLRTLEALPNVHLLGPRPYDRIPGYMQHSDVGLIPFRRSEAMDAVHPIKVYEYLAAGLPVVSTDWEELRRMEAPIHRVTSTSGFVEALDALVRGAVDAESLRSFARANSWSARFDRLQDLLRALPGS